MKIYFIQNEKILKLKALKSLWKQPLIELIMIKEVHCSTKAGENFVEAYDKLILATGSVPISPKVPGRDLENIHF